MDGRVQPARLRGDPAAGWIAEVELGEWPTAPGARIYHGPDGHPPLFATWFEAWEWMQVDVEDVRGRSGIEC